MVRGAGAGANAHQPGEAGEKQLPVSPHEWPRLRMQLEGCVLLSLGSPESWIRTQVCAAAALPLLLAPRGNAGCMSDVCDVKSPHRLTVEAAAAVLCCLLAAAPHGKGWLYVRRV